MDRFPSAAADEPESDRLLKPRQPPPLDYYAGNVRYLLGEVARRSAELLDDDEAALVAAFQGASVAAQRLFARLLTRRGVWLREDSLKYPEVGDAGTALGELTVLGLIERLAPLPADALLRLLTKAELRALFPALGAAPLRSASKPEWIRFCIGRYPDEAIRRRVAPVHPWIGIAAQHAFDVCQVLFFGSGGGDLSTFVTQDLGLMRYERYALNARTRPFANREDLDRYLLCRRLSSWSKSLDDCPDLAPAVVALLTPQGRTRAEQRVRDRVLNRVGRWHERRGEMPAALASYAASTSHPARERRARILHKAGDEAAAAAVLTAMRRQPWCPAEEDFASRFPGRRRRGEPPITTLTLQGSVPARIEQHALALLTGNGGSGWHVENLLPLGLAGLAFWEEIFAPVAGMFSHPFQLGPQDLFWPDFARTRRAQLQAKLECLRRPGGFAAQARRTLAEKHGVTNHLVHWGVLHGGMLDCVLRNVPERRLVDLAAYVIENLERARSGFPDLLVVYGPGAWEVVEVKGPTDQLQGAQRVWLRELAAMEIPARVLRFRAPC